MKKKEHIFCEEALFEHLLAMFKSDGMMKFEYADKLFDCSNTERIMKKFFDYWRSEDCRKSTNHTDIIKTVYMSRKVYTYDELLIKLHLSKSTLLRYRMNYVSVFIGMLKEEFESNEMSYW
jgi:hypothetical protein